MPTTMLNDLLLIPIDWSKRQLSLRNIFRKREPYTVSNGQLLMCFSHCDRYLLSITKHKEDKLQSRPIFPKYNENVYKPFDTLHPIPPDFDKSMNWFAKNATELESKTHPQLNDSVNYYSNHLSALATFESNAPKRFPFDINITDMVTAINKTYKLRSSPLNEKGFYGPVIGFCWLNTNEVSLYVAFSMNPVINWNSTAYLIRNLILKLDHKHKKVETIEHKNFELKVNEHFLALPEMLPHSGIHPRILYRMVIQEEEYVAVLRNNGFIIFPYDIRISKIRKPCVLTLSLRRDIWGDYDTSRPIFSGSKVMYTRIEYGVLTELRNTIRTNFEKFLVVDLTKINLQEDEFKYKDYTFLDVKNKHKLELALLVTSRPSQDNKTVVFMSKRFPLPGSEYLITEIDLATMNGFQQVVSLLNYSRRHILLHKQHMILYEDCLIRKKPYYALRKTPSVMYRPSLINICLQHLNSYQTKSNQNAGDKKSIAIFNRKQDVNFNNMLDDWKIFISALY